MGNSFIARCEHKLYIERKKRKLQNRDFSVLSSNCNGAVILHDLGLRFNSPTVNLYFESKDFLKFLNNPSKYLSGDIKEKPTSLTFPVGIIEDISVYFMHYKSFDEAKQKWIERSKRIKTDNLFIMMTDKSNCTYEDIAEFDKLPYKNKVIFTHIDYPEFESAVYIKGFESEKEVGVLSDWKPGFWKRRWLDDFDYISFFNRGINKE